jgi:predicted ABC-type ATPase
VIWDITMSSKSSAAKRIQQLRDAGYSNIEGVFVHIPVDKSVERAEARHRRGLEDYRNGEGLGGRYVPPDVIRANADPTWGSVNRGVFEELRPQFDRWRIYDNSVDGRDPVLLESSDSSEGNEDE